MVYITKTELNKIKADYKRMKVFLVKARLLDKYVTTNKTSRSFFDRRINLINKMIKSKTR